MDELVMHLACFLCVKALIAILALHLAADLHAHIADATITRHRLRADLQSFFLGSSLLLGSRCGSGLCGLGAQEAGLVIVLLAIQWLLLQRHWTVGIRVLLLKTFLPTRAWEL